MPVPGRSKGFIGNIPETLQKAMQYPGQCGYAGDPLNAKQFTQVSVDQLFPLTGLDNNPTFYIRADGYYDLWFQVRQPSYRIVGWGNGFSGDGGGEAAIYTNRYGHQALQSWAGNGEDWGDNWMTAYVGKQYFYYGDYVQFHTKGWATGLAPQDFDRSAWIRKWRS